MGYHRNRSDRLVLAIAMVGLMALWCLGRQGRVEAYDGLAFESERLHPGKADFIYKYKDAGNEYNAIWWSPVFKGGFGILDFDKAEATDYQGGFVRPFQGHPDMGELILGFSHVGSASADSHELQGEYRLPSGLGVGGGFVQQDGGGADVAFGKVTYRNAVDEWSYIAEIQGQEMGHSTSVGGYLAVYDQQFMAVAGHDGEQWRATLGYVAPTSEGLLRPAVEVLYVDNSTGHLDGTRFLFINSTLKFKGGFLSHPARLGRAMGPQGLEFGNPLSFLRPTWNRRLDVWELGGLANARLVRTQSAAGATTSTYEVVAFPFQLDAQADAFDGLFTGISYATSPGVDSPGVLNGFIGKIGFFQLAVEHEYNVDTREHRVTFGIIDKF